MNNIFFLSVDIRGYRLSSKNRGYIELPESNLNSNQFSYHLPDSGRPNGHLDCHMPRSIVPVGKFQE